MVYLLLLFSLRLSFPFSNLNGHSYRQGACVLAGAYNNMLVS